MLFPGVALATVLAASGCVPVVGPHADVDDRMFSVASRYEKARREGGMVANVEDIKRCYVEASCRCPRCSHYATAWSTTTSPTGST